MAMKHKKFKTWQIKHDSTDTLITVGCTGIYASKEKAVEAQKKDPVIEPVDNGECIMHSISEINK